MCLLHQNCVYLYGTVIPKVQRNIFMLQNRLCSLVQHDTLKYYYSGMNIVYIYVCFKHHQHMNEGIDFLEPP